MSSNSNFAKTLLNGVTYFNPLKSDNGYTLYSSLGSRITLLIDMEGNIVHTWRPPVPGYSRLLPNGRLCCCGKRDFPSSVEGFPPEREEFNGYGDNILQELDWNSRVVWEAPVPWQSHDFFSFDEARGSAWPKNGHYIYPTYTREGRFPPDLAKKWLGGLPGFEFEGTMWGDVFYEIDRQGKIVWEWQCRDHLDPVLDAFPPITTRANFHTNSVYLCHDGSILWSPRMLSQVYKIAYPGGEIIGRYGKGEIFNQHSAIELSNENILVFDNGSNRSNYYGPAYSRAVEIDPKTNKVVWDYKSNPASNFYSAIVSSAERLPNDNTLICGGYNGRIFEVTPNGELVWEYIVPVWSQMFGGAMHMIYRAHRYPRDYAGLSGRDLDPARWKWENRLYGPSAWRNGISRPRVS